MISYIIHIFYQLIIKPTAKTTGAEEAERRHPAIGRPRRVPKGSGPGGPGMYRIYGYKVL